MAQRTVHYVFGELLAAECGVKDRRRFLLGSILPDGYTDHAERESAHFLNHSLPGKRYFDFERFRAQFAERMMTDDLYLGYYMHLVEDDFYREFLHRDLGRVTRGAEDVEALHRDYHLLNAHIVERYRIQNILEKPADFEREPICKLAHFDLDGLLEAFAQDIQEKPVGEAQLLTEALLDEFLERYVPLGVKEMACLLCGKTILRAADFAWARNAQWTAQREE